MDKITQISGDVLTGFAKGIGDTLYSVKKNVQKVPVQAVKNEVQDNFQRARDGILKASEEVAKKYRATPDGPQKDALRTLLVEAQNDLNEISDGERVVMNEINKVQRGEIDYREDAGLLENVARATQNSLNVAGTYLRTKNKAQEFGFAAEKIAELIVPAGQVAKVDKVLNGTKFINDASKVGQFADKAIRATSRIGAEAAAAATATLGQSAYQGKLDTEQGREQAVQDAGTSALFSGALKGVMMAGGQILNKAGAAEKFARGTYKTSADEISKGGEKLADWAIKNNIKGNLKQQAEQVAEKMAQYEDELISSAQAQGKRIPVDKDFMSFIETVWDDYATGPYKNKVLPIINKYLGSIDETGTADVASTLEVKRLLDKLRPDATFKNASIGTDMKGWSEILRSSVNDIPELSAINKNYSKALSAAEAIYKRAAQEGNKQLVSQLDTILAVSPIVVREGAPRVNDLAGLAAVAARKTIANPGVQMNVAQGIKKLGQSTPVGVATRSVVGSLGTDAVNELGGEPDIAGVPVETKESPLKPVTQYQKASESELTELDRKLMGL